MICFSLRVGGPHSWISWLTSQPQLSLGVTHSLLHTCRESSGPAPCLIPPPPRTKCFPLIYCPNFSLGPPVEPKWFSECFSLLQDFHGKIKFPDRNNGLTDEWIRPCFLCLVVSPHKCFSSNSVTALGEMSRTLSSGLFFHPTILAISQFIFQKGEGVDHVLKRKVLRGPKHRKSLG